MKIGLEVLPDRKAGRTVHRRQFPVTAAYAFTDYRLQGQTIPAVVVDLAPPPVVDLAPPPRGGGLNLFSLYVALSRSSGRDTIRLLRPFKSQPIKERHNLALLAEDN
ncbi:hypothetical protein PENSPDRAFT_695435 [Peniophora sp. CONT]|nr:hypothetical protein PENSPDRAFT_695435 [Peniophora sp. CONT]